MSNLYTGEFRIEGTQVDPSFQEYYVQDHKKLFGEDGTTRTYNIRQESLVHFTIKLAYLVSTYGLHISNLEDGFKTEDLRSHIDIINEKVLCTKLSLIEQYTAYLHKLLIGTKPLTRDVGYVSTTNPKILESDILKSTVPLLSFEFSVPECKHSTLAYFDPDHPVPLIDRTIKEYYFLHTSLYAYTHTQCLDQLSYDLSDDFLEDNFTLDLQVLKSYIALIRENYGNEHARKQCYLSTSFAYQVTRALLYSYLIDHRFDTFVNVLDLDDPDFIRYDQNLKLREAAKTLLYSLSSNIYTPEKYSLSTDIRSFTCSTLGTDVSGQVTIGNVKDTSEHMPIEHLLYRPQVSEKELPIYRAFSACIDILQTHLTGLTNTIENLKAQFVVILLHGDKDHQDDLKNVDQKH